MLLPFAPACDEALIMAGQQDHEQGDPVTAAIARVLKIERDGVQQLQHSQEQAQLLLARARAQAATIARQADACISQLHNSYLQKVQRNIESLAQSNLSSERADHAYDTVTIVQTAHRVAAKLTGAA
jgi:vacuolar-type H+-ATPase subunit H